MLLFPILIFKCQRKNVLITALIQDVVSLELFGVNRYSSLGRKTFYTQVVQVSHFKKLRLLGVFREIGT